MNFILFVIAVELLYLCVTIRSIDWYACDILLRLKILDRQIEKVTQDTDDGRGEVRVCTIEPL